MTLLAALTKRSEQRTQIAGPQPLTSKMLAEIFAPSSSTAGMTVSEETVIGLTAVYRSIALIGGTIARSPFNAHRRSDDVLVASRLMQKPNPVHTTFELIELIIAHLLLHGNAYLLKEQSQRGVEAVFPLDPSKVTPKWVIDKRTGMRKDKVFEVRDDSTGEAIGLDKRDLLHIPGLSFDGLEGMAPLRYHREALGTAMAAERFASKFWSNGSLMSGILHTDRRLSEDTATALKDRWKKKVAGIDNAQDIAILDSGAKFQSLTIPPEDAQFLESRSFSVREIARIFGVPPHLLMETEAASNWGTGIEQQNQGLVLFTLDPWTGRVEGRWSDELLPGTQYSRFDLSRLKEGDTNARWNSHAVARQNKIVSINDVRNAEGLPPIDDPRADDPFFDPGAVVELPAGDSATTDNEPPPEDGESQTEE